MESLAEKSVRTSEDIKYTYWTSPAAPLKPTLLLLHGCPDSASLWTNLIEDFLVPAGYGFVAPDLIGYGKTDKPEGVENYSASSITKHLVSILDQEGLQKAVVLGHDFGAYLASMFCVFEHSRAAGLVTLGTAYLPPSSVPFDFDQIRQMQEQYLGYCSIWYIPFFTSEEGYQVIDDNLENMFTALHGGGDRMKSVCCHEGAMERWLKDPSNASKEVLPYAESDGFREDWINRFKRDSWRAPLNWYKATSLSLAHEAEVEALKEGRQVLKIPYLFISASKDPLAPAGAVQGPISQGLLPDVTTKEVHASHWCMLEEPRNVGEDVVQWLADKF